jgi:predicted RNA-binding Zn-ribbon protein involved in translation (DUF1610 family)
MTETFTPRPFQSIIEQSLRDLEEATNYPLVPDPLNNTQEANIMLPDNRPHDQRNFTTATEDEFECDRCGNTDYRLINYETQGEIRTYAKCLECGWRCPSTTAIASVGGVG